MLQKKFQLSFAVIFFLILLIVPVYWMVPGRTVIKRSMIEHRELEPFPSLLLQKIRTAGKRLLQGQPVAAGQLAFESLTDRSILSKIENAASDQFPMRISFISAAKVVDRIMIKMAYLFLKDVVIPAETKGDAYIMREDPIMMYPPATFTKSTIINVNARIQNYKELMELNPNVNFYVFYVETLEYSPFHPMNIFFNNSDHRQTFQYFEAHNPTGLILGKMLLTSLNEHIKFYYRSDHHWNIHGAWKAYEEIYKMISPQYKLMSLPLKPKAFKTLPGIMFSGTFARIGFIPNAPEKFEVVDVELPPHKIYNRKGEQFEFDHMDSYQAGIYNSDSYVDHYGEYFGRGLDLVEFVYENNASRNILILGNSYAIPVAPWIASHYHHSYLVNLNYFKDFSYQKFIQKHNIDDVLFIGGQIAISNPVWIINP